MPFRIEDFTDVSGECRQLARTLADTLIVRLEDATSETDAVVHEVRKGIKRLRALLRLVHPVIGDEAFDQENTVLREAAHRLAGARDRHVLEKTFAGLGEELLARLSSEEVVALGATLDRSLGEVGQPPQDSDIAAVRSALMGFGLRTRTWIFATDGWEALTPGLALTYGKGRQAMERALRKPTTEDLHAWRRRVKDLWHQHELLANLWPEVFTVLAEQVHALSDALGDDHDLGLLAEVLTPCEAPQVACAQFFALIDERRSALQTTARLLGHRLYAEKPSRFVRRLTHYRKAWNAPAVSREAVLA